MTSKEIQTQVEYYLGDINLAKDDFFREQIEQGKDGYIDLALVLKCNKIKKLGVSKAAQIVKACTSSDSVEFSKDGLKLRRKDNKALPDKTGGRAIVDQG